MTTSNTYSYSQTASGIIKRALRLIGAYGQGETPSSVAVTEALVAFNDLVKEYEADGMPLWRIQNVTVPLVASQRSYTIGNNVAYSIVAPPLLKVIGAEITNIFTSPQSHSPMAIITRSQYELLGDYLSPGTPNQIWYDPPGQIDNATGTAFGTFTVYPVPATLDAVNYQIYLTGQAMNQDYSDIYGADTIDFPQYWYNALVWGLADQLSFEYGVPVSDKDRITKKMLYHKDQALSFGTEEGSLYFQPFPEYGDYLNR